MKKLKRNQNKFKVTKMTTQFLIAFVFGWMLCLGLVNFINKYTVQSPITVSFQSPIVLRDISPISEDQNIGSIQKVDGGVTNYFVSPSTTPTPLPKKRTFVPVVEAAEVETNGDPVKEYIKEKFGPDAPIMLKIAQCESGVQAYNWYSKWLGVTKEEADAKGSAVGVFMVLRSVHKQFTMDQMLDYRQNIDYAYQLFQASGTAPWNSSKNCWNK